MDGHIRLCHGKGKTYVAGLMALGAPELKGCEVSGDMDILANGDSRSNSFVCANGLCYEAGTVTESVSRMNFNIGHTDKRRTTCPDISVNGFCYKTVRIYEGAYMGKVNVQSTDDWNVGEIGSLHQDEGAIRNGVFYCKVSGPTEPSTSGEFTFYPLGAEVIDIPSFYPISTFPPTILVLNDDGYFNSTDLNRLKKAEPMIKNPAIYSAYTAAELRAPETLSRLSWGGSWGYVDEGDFKGFPLHRGCGGKIGSTLAGDGSKENPYVIDSKEAFRMFTDDMLKGTTETQGKYFKLTADIDMAGSEPVKCGTNAHTFRGTFDGGGHVIENIKFNDCALFGKLENATVKNLAMVNVDIEKTEGIARTYSDINMGAMVGYLGINSTISDCYVGGDINITVPNLPEGVNYSNIRIGGICGFVVGAKMQNCYVKGHVALHNVFDSSSKNIMLGGLAGYLWEKEAKGCLSSMNDCYASLSFSGNDSYTFNGIAATTEEGKSLMHNCCSVFGNDEVPTGVNGTLRGSDIDIFGDDFYTENTNWIKGAFRPVLKHARNYAATAADGSGTEARFDAIPLADSNNPSNAIFHYTAKENDGQDNLLWTLPNLAIYNQADKSEYILNCRLDPGMPLVYNRKTGCDIEAVKVNMHYPLKLRQGNNYYPLCLPGTVERGDLPDGSKLLVGGQVYDGGGNKFMNVVEADSVAGGVPFIVWIPSAFTDKGGTLDIVIRSRMAQNPVGEIAYDDGNTQKFDLVGTFTGSSDGNALTEVVVADGKPYMACGDGKQSPFTSYLVGDSKVELQDYLLLSESSDDTDRLLEDYDGKERRVVLERPIKANSWNTVCLPFDIPQDELRSVYGDYKLEELASVEPDGDGVCLLKFAAVSGGIEAGHSYLLKPAAVYGNKFTERRISNNIDNEVKSAVIGGAVADVRFCGTFGRKMLGAGDKDGDEYFIQGNRIYHVVSGQKVAMNGFRCYVLADETTSAALSKARLVHSDGTTTSLRLVEDGRDSGGRLYDLQGVELNEGNLPGGVYIKDGRKHMK